MNSHKLTANRTGLLTVAPAGQILKLHNQGSSVTVTIPVDYRRRYFPVDAKYVIVRFVPPNVMTIEPFKVNLTNAEPS